MALKIALLAALCVTQVFAFQPVPAAIARNVACSNPAGEIAQNFDKAVNEIDEVREMVSMTALDAYARGTNFEVILMCFRAQRESFIQLGDRISGMVRDASQKLAMEMGDKAEKYAKLMEVPLNTIAVTLRNLPERVYNHLKAQEFGKAMEVIRESQRIVEANARIVGEVVQKMVGEIPEMAGRVEDMAREINEEARKGSEAIRKAFRKCVQEGGPKKVSSDE